MRILSKKMEQHKATSGKEDALVIVQPDTVIRWHTTAFKRYWRRKVKRGRPSISPQTIALIKRIHKENPLLSPEKIHERLIDLAITDAPAPNTIAKYIKNKRIPPKGCNSNTLFVVKGCFGITVKIKPQGLLLTAFLFVRFSPIGVRKYFARKYVTHYDRFNFACRLVAICRGQPCSLTAYTRSSLSCRSKLRNCLSAISQFFCQSVGVV